MLGERLLSEATLAAHLVALAETAKMAPKTEEFLAKDTKFWVVRPQISGATITGLGTLISGAYLGMEIGKSPERARDFVALDLDCGRRVRALVE